MVNFTNFNLFLLEKRHLETTFKSNDINVLPVTSIHDANASGKTGFLEVLYFIVNI